MMSYTLKTLEKFSNHFFFSIAGKIKHLHKLNQFKLNELITSNQNLP